MVCCPSRVRNVLLPLLLTLPVAAQWRAVPALGSPAPRSGFSLSPWPGGGLLLFGGAANDPLATEWLWSGVEWSPHTTPVPRRQGQAMASSARTGELFVFGGVDAVGVPLADTWRFDGLSWLLLQPVHTPPPLQRSSLCVDPRDESLVLVGWNGGAWQTWSFAGGDWTLVTTAPPPSAGELRLVADSVHGSVLLFATVASTLQVHQLSQGQWRVLGSTPGGFGALAAAADAARGRIVCVAGPVGQPGTTFEWDGLRLLPRPAASAPVLPMGQDLAFAHDAGRAETVLVVNTGQLAVASWSPAPAPLATSFGAPCVDPQRRLSLAPGAAPVPGATHRLRIEGPASSDLAFLWFGLSHTFDGAPLPRPIPLGTLGCRQRVQVLATNFLGAALPAVYALAVPNSATFLGVRYDAQAVVGNLGGLVDATNGLEVQIGQPLADATLVETFATAAFRDPLASGDVWGGGATTSATLGGDGRHGSFDPSIGTVVGPQHYVWDTDNTTIPASSTLAGTAEVVTDGRFHFTDFVVPAGVTIDFTGSSPVQIFARGRIDVAGAVRCNGAAMTTFNGRGATNGPVVYVDGQSGGLPGPGGGRGGNGGNECRGFGPIVQNGIVVTDGQPGEDVRVAAGHAYAASAAGTGGRGGAMNPANGLVPPSSPATALAGIYNPYFATPGAGGGFTGPGGTSTVNLIPLLQVNAAPAPGQAFPLFPFPPVSAPIGYRSLDHFLVGGSGGGGGATHAFGTFNIPGTTFDRYVAGAAGSGGGGALALRAGGDVHIAATGSLQCKGGAGVLIRGHDQNATTNVNWGVTSPGGGGSGGSIVVQSAGAAAVHGAIDASGGDGSRTGQIWVAQYNVTSHAGAGSPGFFRIEAAGNVAVTGSTVPLYVAGSNSGALLDQDPRSGSRSLWLVPPSTGLPRYVRYELLADIGGHTVLFSDDPAIAAMAADDPNGPVLLRFQGARVDASTGQVLAGTFGPWRTRIVAGPGTLNEDRAEAVRFDLVLDKALGATAVRELRIVWR